MQLAPLSLPRATEAQRHGAVSGALRGITTRTENALCATNSANLVFFRRFGRQCRGVCSTSVTASLETQRGHGLVAARLRCVSVSLWPVIGVFVAHFLTATQAHAQAQVEFIPAVSLFTVFDDNIFAGANSTAGQMLQLRPSFEGSYETPITRLLGFYSFDMQRSNFSSLTTLDARRHALGDAQFRTTPFTTLGVGARYDRSNTPGDINFDTGILGERRNAERVEVVPSFAWRLGPRTSLSSNYDWISEHLVDGERGTLQIGRIGLSRDLSSRTAITAGYITRYFIDHVNGFPNYYSNAFLAGWSRVLTQGTTLSLAAGPKFRARRGLHYESSASFVRATPRVRLAADYWHGETIVLGVLGPVAVDSVTGRAAWPVRRFEVGAMLGASDVTTLDERSSRVYRGTLFWSWNPGGIYSVAATYDADFQNGSIRNPIFLDSERILFDEEVLRHVFRVSVTIAPRYRRSILPPDEAARVKGVSR